MKTRNIVLFISVMALTIAGLLSYAYFIVMHPIVKLDETAYIYIYPYDTEESITKKITGAVGNTNIQGFKLLAWHNNLDKQKRQKIKSHVISNVNVLLKITKSQ